MMSNVNHKFSRRRKRSGRGYLRLLLCLFVFGIVINPMGAVAETDTKPLRVGFSSSTFLEVNENDALAAVKVWSATIAKERGVVTDPTLRVLNGLPEISQALVSKSIDAISLSTEEYWHLRPALDDRIFIVGRIDGSISEEYLLLVHQDSGIQRIEDLRGRKLIFFLNPRMSLASIWLDTLLLQKGALRTTEFCSATHNYKLANTVLAVFFRQVDACVVTRRSFKVMNELNPQLSQKLKILVSSPKFVPAGFTFRRDYNDTVRKTIIRELTKVANSPEVTQIQTLFQIGDFEAQPVSCLDRAFELLATHQRLLAKTKTGALSKAENVSIGDAK